MPHRASPTLEEPHFPDAKMHLVLPGAPVIGRLVSTESCMKGKSASFVRHINIDVSGTPLAGNFLVGQSFGVIPPGLDAHGKPHKVRLYSIASPSFGEDGRGNILSTTVKRTIDEYKPQLPGDDPTRHDLFLGVCSNYLCNINPGTEVMVSGPNGKRFVLPTAVNDHDYVFIATGTGIAPFRGMVLELFQGPSGPTTSQVHLIMGSPYATDLLYDDLFTRLAREHANFHYHTAISRETRPDGRRGQYVHHLVNDRIADFRALLASPRTLLYVCGLKGMQFGLFKVLAQHSLGEPYMTIKPDLASVDPSQWTDDKITRYVRPTRRCMLEVY